MGLWRNLALINLTNPNALSQDVKNALQAKWEYEVTHPKKKNSLGDKIKGVAKGLLTGNMMYISTSLATNPKQTIQTYGNILTGNKGVSTSSTSMLPEVTSISKNTKKSKGLTQLRQARGSAGGGSYTEAVKNPLGGSAGKTGK